MLRHRQRPSKIDNKDVTMTPSSIDKGIIWRVSDSEERCVPPQWHWCPTSWHQWQLVAFQDIFQPALLITLNKIQHGERGWMHCVCVNHLMYVYIIRCMFVWSNERVIGRESQMSSFFQSYRCWVLTRPPRTYRIMVMREKESQRSERWLSRCQAIAELPSWAAFDNSSSASQGHFCSLSNQSRW